MEGKIEKKKKAPHKPLARLIPCKSWKEGLPIPEIVFYTEPNFGGESYRTNCDVEYVGDAFNNKILSVVIVSGTWKFYNNAKFSDGNKKPELNLELKPGYYTDLTSFIPNPNISSFNCIKL